MNMNFEYIAAHISDYIQSKSLFHIFNVEDIESIMNYSKLTADQYITLLKQSSSRISAKELYICTRKASVSCCMLSSVKM